MFTLLQRRIVRDIVTTFIVALFVITLLMMFIGVGREAINQGLAVAGVLRLIPYALPDALSLAVPGTALFSIVSVYGRMAADNEFTALQSVGIPPLAAMLPALAIATLLSLATVGLINFAFTWGFHGMQRVVVSSVEQVAYSVLQRSHSFQHEQLSLTVQDVRGKELIAPVIHIRRGNDQPIQITAKSAVLTYQEKDEALELSITNGSLTVGEDTSLYFPDTFVQSIPLRIQPEKDLLQANPSHMTMQQIPVATRQLHQDIHRREAETAARVGFSLVSARPEQLIDATAKAQRQSVRSGYQRLQRLGTEMQRRWASGFTCLAMATIGIPLAIRLRTVDTMSTFGFVFLPTIVIYYPIFALTLDLAKDGKIPAYGIWTANFIYFFVGAWMLRKSTYSRA